MIAKHYMTIEDVSSYIKIPEETVYKYARTGAIPAAKLGRHWRFERERIDDWIVEQSNQEPEAVRVLIVDDEPLVQKLFSQWLTDEGHVCTGAETGEAALEMLRREKFDLVLLDLKLPGINGAQILGELKKIAASSEVVVVTAFFDSELMDDALEFGPVFLLKKPVDKNTLLSMVRSMAVKHR